MAITTLNPSEDLTSFITDSEKQIKISSGEYGRTKEAGEMREKLAMLLSYSEACWKASITTLVPSSMYADIKQDLNNLTSLYDNYCQNNNIRLLSSFEQVQSKLLGNLQKLPRLPMAKKSELHHLLNNLYQKFSDDSKKFDKDLEAINKEVLSYKESSEKDLAEIGRIKRNAKAAGGLIGRIAISAGYNSSAWINKMASFLYSSGAIALMLYILYEANMIISDLSHIKDVKTMEIFVVIFRLVFLTACAMPAYYLARLAHKHFLIGTVSRNKHLELKSISAYLEPLDEQSKSKILQVLAFKYFGNYDYESLNKETDMQCMVKYLQTSANKEEPKSY